MNDKINRKLTEVIADLDVAINRAVENPLLFSERPLEKLQSTCRELMAMETSVPMPRNARQRNETEMLLWRVRARAGRLQKLLDSAACFYANSFSRAHAGEFAYGANGEWNNPALPRYLGVEL